MAVYGDSSTELLIDCMEKGLLTYRRIQLKLDLPELDIRLKKTHPVFYSQEKLTIRLLCKYRGTNL
jgi:hypothetical protein